MAFAKEPVKQSKGVPDMPIQIQQAMQECFFYKDIDTLESMNEIWFDYVKSVVDVEKKWGII